MIRNILLVLFITLTISNTNAQSDSSLVATYRHYEARNEYFYATKAALKLGETNLAARKYAEAQKWFANASKQAVKVSNDTLAGYTYYRHGDAIKQFVMANPLREAEMDQAIRLFARAEQIYLNSDYNYNLTHIAINLSAGEAFSFKGESEKAIKPLELALQFAPMHDNEGYVLRACNLLIEAYTLQGRTEQDPMRKEYLLEKADKYLSILNFYTALYSDRKKLGVTKEELGITQKELAKKEKDLEKKEEQLSAREEELNITRGVLANREKELAVKKQELDSTRRSLEATRVHLDRTAMVLDSTRLSLDITRQELGVTIDSLNQTYSTLQITDSIKNIIDADLQAKRNQLKQTSDVLEKKKSELSATAEELDNTKVILGDTKETLTRTEAEREQFMYFLIGTAALLILAIFAYMYVRKQRRKLAAKNSEIMAQQQKLQIQHQKLIKQANVIKREKENSDRLLLNILPLDVANELKLKNRVEPKYYRQATIMFTDFKGFTRIASHKTPKYIVDELNFCFRHFDSIVKKFGLEKIKTIGDGYMCAGGIPNPNSTNPIDTIKAAMQMQKFMHEWQQDKMRKGEDYFELRIGIHTGPIVAGVVGAHKFAYDIWGDAVNVASRMESNGVEGKINISETTFNLVKNDFSLTYRGRIDVKNKGEMNMYFVNDEIDYLSFN